LELVKFAAENRMSLSAVVEVAVRKYIRKGKEARTAPVG
jgi:hypothetical protein